MANFNLFNFFKKGISASAVETERDNNPVKETITDVDNSPINVGQPQVENTDYNILWNVPNLFNNSTGIMNNKQSNAFNSLRAYAESNTVIQYCIQQRQMKIAQMNFIVRYKDKKKQKDSKCEAVEKLLNFPNRSQTSSFEFFMALMNDLLILDAVSIKPMYDANGDVVSIELLDSAYVTVKVDGRGQIPGNNEVAYQFDLKSKNILNSYSIDDLLYVKMNPRTHTPYGHSPVEKCIKTLEQLIKRRNYQDNYFTEGTLPDSMISVHDKMTPKQMMEYQHILNATGKITKNQVKLIPHDWKLIQAKNLEMKLEIDELYAREICAIFNVSASALISDINKATAESNRKQAISNGDIAYIKFIENVMTRLINLYIGYNDLEFSFIQEDAIDPLQQNQALQLATGGKPWMTVNEARAVQGYGPNEELNNVSDEENPLENDDSNLSATGENRLIGQKDIKSSNKDNKAELPNPNEDR